MERMQFLIRVLLIAGFIQILSAVERGLNDNWSLRNVNKGENLIDIKDSALITVIINFYR